MAQTSRTKPQRQLEEPAALAVCHALLPVELGTLGFGLPLAVTSFSRYSRAVEALGRRCPCISMIPTSQTGRHRRAALRKLSLASMFVLGRRLLKQSGNAWQPLVPSWAWILIVAIACTLGWLSSLFVNA